MAKSGPVEDRLVGRVLKDTYVLEQKIGSGGFGAVYRARHAKLGSSFAIKFLLPHADEQARVRFTREAQISATVAHPNIARVLDYDHDEMGTPYMVIEWVEGVSLRDLLHKKGALSLVETQSLYRQFSSAMEAAHALGIVHRDLKPENLLLTQVGGVALLKVLDFGIARLAGAEEKLTVGFVIGTPSYMAPETAKHGSSGADPRVDIYAMGLILYECLTARRAIDGEAPQIFAKQLTTGIRLKSVRLGRPELPEVVDQVIARACEYDPTLRFQKATELSQALDAIEPPDNDAPQRALLPFADINLIRRTPTPAPMPTHGHAGTGSQPADTPPLAAIRALEAAEPAVTPAPESEGEGATTVGTPQRAISISQDSDLDADERGRRKRLKLVAMAAAGAVALAGVTWAAIAWHPSSTGAGAVEKKVETKPQPPPGPVRMPLVGAPYGIRAYDKDAKNARLTIDNGVLVLPAGTKSMRVRFEAPRHAPFEMTVVPSEITEIHFD